MSSFIYFIFVIVVALLLARYNESNKLFWTLLVSLMAGMAGWTLYQKLTTSDKVKQNSITQIQQNGISVNKMNDIAYFSSVILNTNDNKVPVPFYKEIESEYASNTVSYPSQCYITRNYPPPRKILHMETFFNSG